VLASPNAEAVWTGHELLIGGVTYEPTTGYSRVAYDPSSGRTRPLTGFPAGVEYAGSPPVWSGHLEYASLVSGGDEAPERMIASFDPVANRWRTLPTDPLPATDYVQLVWTGRDLIALGIDEGPAEGAVAPRPSPLRAAVYDPSTNRWQALPDLPARSHGRMSSDGSPLAVWAGARLLVWRPWSGFAPDPQSGGQVQIARTDLAEMGADGRWRDVPTPSSVVVGAYESSPIWTGSRVFLPVGAEYLTPAPTEGITSPAWSYDPSANRYQQLSGNQLNARGGQMAWTGGAMVAFGFQGAFSTLRSLAQAYDPTHDAWTFLPPPPAAPLGFWNPIWTGRQLFVLASDAHKRTTLLEYTPRA
jgi:hypothetical protein